MDGTGGHYANCNKLDTKSEILHVLTYFRNESVDFTEEQSTVVVTRDEKGQSRGGGKKLDKEHQNTESRNCF
jgi:hypothetical protein